ncbi:hypothetical protein SYJ56_13735 [Algoriphagus sp. D3-2-R+10]|uniref:hypothetical protein n=1 Tax=Algoriphagus aurantiacus TaxID=3103948 RepID=UPI002B3EB943|nr:hypothetical protein [Algoriphagus sp. D3-2-R+10]MEB2776379.1 hypothetical protein [Algoriphagus sp. D3-2-R+10]
MEKIRNEISMLMADLDTNILKYDKLASAKYTTWKALQLITIVTGFTTSIVVIISLVTKWTDIAKIICVFLPFLGSFAASLISYLKPLELYIQKVNAKIEFKNLLVSSKIQFAKCSSLDDYQNLLELIIQKIGEIENLQDKKF